MASGIVFALPAGGTPTPASAPPGCTQKPGILNCPWKMKPWYDALNSKLTLVSTTALNSGQKNCNWPGAEGVINSNTNDFPLGGCGRPFYVWAKKCTAAAQTVDFKKKMFLPGVPAVLQASLLPYKRPLRSMEILVNGRVLLATSRAVHKVDLKGKAGAFKFGNNVIEISARKGPSKTSCNDSGHENDTGFLMELHAGFRADVVATIDPINSAAFIQFITVKNNGPSTTDYGSVTFSVTTSKLKVTNPSIDPNAAIIITAGDPLGEPLPICMYFGSGGYSTYCQIDALKPGESRTYAVRYFYNAPPTGSFFDQFTEKWGAAMDTLDPNQANNGGSRTRHACRPEGTPPCVKS